MKYNKNVLNPALFSSVLSIILFYACLLCDCRRFCGILIISTSGVASKLASLIEAFAN